MFATSSAKPNQFEVYNVVQTNFANIKNLNCFNSSDSCDVIDVDPAPVFKKVDDPVPFRVVVIP